MRLNMRSKAIVKKSGPSSLKIAWRIGGSKSFLYEFRPFGFRAAEQCIEQFNFRKPAKEREDHWLKRQVITPGCERVAPRFQIMRERNVPVAERRCGVLVITESHNLRDLFLQIGPVQREIGLAILHQTALCIVNRITAENEESLDPAVIYVRREL